MQIQSSEVLVVGAGLAGFVAALRASEQGAKAVLIDKSDGDCGDGNTLMTSGSLRAAGRSPRSNPTDLYELVMAQGVGYPDLVKAWSETCGRAVEWLVRSGVVIKETKPGRVWLDQESEISLAPVYKKHVGRKALMTLRRRFEDLGGKFENGIEARRLLLQNSRVGGVLGTSSRGDIELRSRTTILTTGGFSANQAMVKQYIGPRAGECKLRGAQSCTGDGLRMALDAGAKAINLQYFYGHLLSRKALTDDRFWPYPRLDAFVDEGILVNRSAERFVDEGRGDVAVANDVARSADVADNALIFDDETWQAAKDDAFSASVKTPAPNSWLADHQGDIYFASFIEGLAHAIGVDAARLAATVEQYNQAVESNNTASLPVPRTGRPKPLRAPFCALKVVPGITFTMGGALVNGCCEVLDDNENPIAGLYAAGDTIGGLMGGYRGGYTGGLLQALVTGILAGENAAHKA